MGVKCRNSLRRTVRRAVAMGRILTQALFDEMGAGKDLCITGRQLEHGVRELLVSSDDTVNICNACVVIGVAKQVAREMKPDDVIYIKEFEPRTQEAYRSLTFKHLNSSDLVVPSAKEYVAY